MPGVARKLATGPRPGGAVRSQLPATRVLTPPRPRPAPPRPTRRFIVGLDYGTTRASAAYLNVDDAERGDPTRLKPHLGAMRVFDGYPFSQKRPDVSTVVMYEPGKKDQPTALGFPVEKMVAEGMVPKGAILVPMAKLLLHDSGETKTERDRLQALAKDVKNRCNYEPDFIADFLRKMRESIVAQMRKAGCQFDEAEIEWVLCVPAAWSEDEHVKMVKAADRGGILNATLVSEPEAAALVVLLERDNEQWLDLTDGDTFIVCDGGGGTVDIMTYNIIQRHPLKLRETAIGGGILCGSTYLDKRFEDLVQEKLEQYPRLSVERRNTLTKLKKAEFAKDYKLNFDGPEHSPMFIRELITQEIRIESDEITTRVFDPIVNQIGDLLEKQITESGQGVEPSPLNEGATPARVKSIILTGGLGDNPYLYDRLKERFYTEASPGGKVTVARPDVSGTAVARGGLLLGIHAAGVVTERRSRFSYGFDIAEPWDDAKEHHEKGQQRMDPCQHKLWADTVIWALKKGDLVRVGDIIHSGTRYRNIPDSIKHEPVTDSLIVSEDVQDFPTWKGALSNAEETYMLETDLSGLAWETFDALVNEETGERYYSLLYDIFIRINAVNSATVEVVHKLPGGGEHRQIIPQLVKYDSKAASLQTRGADGTPHRISPRSNKRKTFAEFDAESVPQRKLVRNQGAKKSKPSPKTTPRKGASTQKADPAKRQRAGLEDKIRHSGRSRRAEAVRVDSGWQEEHDDDESTVDFDAIFNAIAIPD